MPMPMANILVHLNGNHVEVDKVKNASWSIEGHKSIQKLAEQSIFRVKHTNRNSVTCDE